MILDSMYIHAQNSKKYCILYSMLCFHCNLAVYKERLVYGPQKNMKSLGVQVSRGPNVPGVQVSPQGTLGPRGHLDPGHLDPKSFHGY